MAEFKERDVRHLNLRAAPPERRREEDELAQRSWRDLIATWLEGVMSGATAPKVDDHTIEEPVAPAQIQQLTEALATWTKGRGSREPGQTPPEVMLSRFRRNSLRDVLDTLTTRPDLRAATLDAADPTVAPPVRPRGPRASKVQGEALWRASERRAATLYRRAAGARTGHHDDPAVREALARCGTGEALPAELRTRMERALGVPLGRVRIHTDGVAAAAADAVDAEAFTVGEDVFFAAGKFDPQSTSGRSLIAHELTHVVQSWQGRTASKPAVSTTSDPLEREAETVAAKTVEPKSNTSEQQYGGGASRGTQASGGQAASGGAAPGGPVSSQSFQVTNFTASTPGGFHTERQGTGAYVYSAGFHLGASVDATTPEARAYNIGFFQTIHGSVRRAIYKRYPDWAIVNRFEVLRQEGMDIRTGPAPWYNGSVPASSGHATPAMDDFPRVFAPFTSPEPNQGTLRGLEGQESFTTYLVAWNGTGPHIFLGNINWSVSWAGTFDNHLMFSGGRLRHPGHGNISSQGGAVTGGEAANNAHDGPNDGRWIPVPAPPPAAGPAAAAAPAAGGAAVQRKASGSAPDGDPVAIASRGVSGSGGQLPHLEAIQQSFGHHDVSGISSHVGGAASDATRGLAASAYAFGNSIAFDGAPDLHTAAHEAAHVVQQRRGVSLTGNLDGGASDPHERQADAIADAVVAGKSAEALLDGAGSGGGGGEVVQRASKTTAKAVGSEISAATKERMSHDVDFIVGLLQSQLQLQTLDGSASNVIVTKFASYAKADDPGSTKTLDAFIAMLRRPYKRATMATLGQTVHEDVLTDLFHRLGRADLERLTVLVAASPLGAPKPEAAAYEDPFETVLLPVFWSATAMLSFGVVEPSLFEDALAAKGNAQLLTSIFMHAGKGAIDFMTFGAARAAYDGAVKYAEANPDCSIGEIREAGLMAAAEAVLPIPEIKTIAKQFGWIATADQELKPGWAKAIQAFFQGSLKIIIIGAIVHAKVKAGKQAQKVREDLTAKQQAKQANTEAATDASKPKAASQPKPLLTPQRSAILKLMREVTGDREILLWEQVPPNDVYTPVRAGPVTAKRLGIPRGSIMGYHSKGLKVTGGAIGDLGNIETTKSPYPDPFEAKLSAKARQERQRALDKVRPADEGATSTEGKGGPEGETNAGETGPVGEGEPPEALVREQQQTNHGKVVETVSDGKAVVPTAKVEVFARGGSEFSKAMVDELRQLQQQKQTARHEFDAKPENAARIEQLKALKKNAQRSNEMARLLHEAGLPASVAADEGIMRHLLEVGNRVTPESRLDVKSELHGPDGTLKVLSTWKIDAQGRAWLVTLKLIPATDTLAPKP